MSTGPKPPGWPPGWKVRPMLSDDIAGVVALAAGEPAAPHWPVVEYRRMLDVIAESPTRRGAWVLLLPEPSAQGGPSSSQVTESRQTIIGFAMASHVAGVCELEAVVVDPHWRGRRLGEALVETAAAWGRNLNAERLELEVRASNTPARRLYERMGFDFDGSRPGYYRNPDEDAVLMSRQLQR